jgi:hypothetical protein
MLSPRLTNCPECANIPSLLRKIDCKLAELGNNLYNNISYMLNKPVPGGDILQLIGYRRILQYKYINPNYAHLYSVNMIASRVIRLTAGCVSRCNEPERCLEVPCDITIVPNPTTTSTSTLPITTTTTSSSSSTSTTTSTSSTSTTTSSSSTSTTTSTSSTSSTTTTTTTLVFPSASPCVWTRDIDVVGSIDVYDVVTNTTVSISVPNDFATPTGITMQASTNNKLWIGDGLNTIKEWNIMQETLSLSFVRNITVGNFGPNRTQPNAIAAINDTNIYLGNSSSTGGSVYVGYWDISSPTATISSSNFVAQRPLGITNTYGVISEVTGLTYTNSGSLFVSIRQNFNTASDNVGNYITEYYGIMPISNFVTWQKGPTIKVQNTIDFTLGYTGRKAFDLFGWNNKIYLNNPETSNFYQIDQNATYGISLLTSGLGYSDTQTFWASTGCSNIDLVPYAPNCTPTALPVLRDGSSGPYIGPISFNYSGMTVQASSTNFFGMLGQPSGVGYITNCTGMYMAENTVVFNRINGTCSLDTPAYNYTLTFPTPVNNLPFRLSICDFGDDFRFTTNSGTPSISINTACFMTVSGNDIITGLASGGGGSGEFVITAPSDFTEITFSGTNCGFGGPVSLGCFDNPVVTTSTTTLFPPTTTTTTTIAGVNTVFTYFEGITP